MAGNQRKDFCLLLVLKEREIVIMIDVFHLGKEGTCCEHQLLEIKDKLTPYIHKNEAPLCQDCKITLSQQIFVYSNDKCVCSACFEGIPSKKTHAFVFFDMSIKNSILKNWNQKVEEKPLPFSDNYQKKSPKIIWNQVKPSLSNLKSSRIKSYERRSQNFRMKKETRSKMVSQQKIIEDQNSIDKRKHRQFQILRRFKEATQEEDIDMMEFIIGDLHEQSSEKAKAFALRQYKSLTTQREKMEDQLQYLTKRFRERHQDSEIIYSSSESAGNHCKSDVDDFQMTEIKTQTILKEADNWMMMHKYKNKGNKIVSKKPMRKKKMKKKSKRTIVHKKDDTNKKRLIKKSKSKEKSLFKSKL